ncbi:MAG TPA: hypothetical protein VHI95_06430 [Acidimicrobiales bacterium]|nr:hypothetical protein [Acidimicrobiales bacterium]
MSVAMDVPVTRYADTERGAIAFQVVGDGPLTSLVSKGPGLPVDLMWEEPSLARFVAGLGSFSRSIWFDPLGTGSSDALEEIEDRLGEGVAADMESMALEREHVRDFLQRARPPWRSPACSSVRC